MELDNIVPWGRSFNEYKAFFNLSDSDLDKTILGCSDGPASFNTELTDRGGQVVSVDPIYQFDAKQLQKRIIEVYDEVIPEVQANYDSFVWDSIGSVEELANVRMTAMETFLSDYDNGKRAGRYITASLPTLPFDNLQFDIALCSHYLFLYSDHVSLEQHTKSVVELARVAKEVRIYPLVSLSGAISSHLHPVMSALSELGLVVLLVDVAYEFQKGAKQMLAVNSL